MSLDEAIKKAYVLYKIPADRVVVDKDLRTEFSSLVNRLMGSKAHESTICRRLITLRKKGQARGGLVRLTGEPYGR